MTPGSRGRKPAERPADPARGRPPAARQNVISYFLYNETGSLCALPVSLSVTPVYFFFPQSFPSPTATPYATPAITTNQRMLIYHG